MAVHIQMISPWRGKAMWSNKLSGKTWQMCCMACDGFLTRFWLWKLVQKLALEVQRQNLKLQSAFMTAFFVTNQCFIAIFLPQDAIFFCLSNFKQIRLCALDSRFAVNKLAAFNQQGSRRVYPVVSIILTWSWRFCKHQSDTSVKISFYTGIWLVGGIWFLHWFLPR